MEFLQFDLINVGILAVVTTIFVSSCIIYFRNQKNLTNKLFFFFCLSIVFWGVSMILFRSASSSNLALFWCRLLYFFPPFIPLLFVYFSQVFPKPDHVFKWYERVLPLLPLILLGLVCFLPDQLISSVTVRSNLEPEILFNFWPYFYYSALVSIYWGWAYIVLSRRLGKAKTEVEKKSATVMFVGVVISTLIAVVFNLILPFYGVFTFNWLGQIGCIVMISCILYSIIQYDLFDIKVVATEIFSVLLLILLGAKLISSNSKDEFLLNIFVFGFTSLISWLLVRSVKKEVESRHRIEKLARDLKKSNEELEVANELKARFLSIASHQFRSPLTAIKGYASLLLDGSYGKISESVEEPVERILTASNNLSLVVDDFLNLSRIEQGRMEYKFEEVDLREFLQSVVDEQEAVVQKKKDLTLKFYVKGDGPFGASIDRAKLKQVATNLVDNAIKYTPSGSIDVYLERDNEEGVFRFWTKDTGVGIPLDVLPRLFSQFTRAANADTVNVMGTGLGLYIAREIVIAHGGEIRAESDGEGKGAQFTVELPIKRG